MEIIENLLKEKEELKKQFDKLSEQLNNLIIKFDNFKKQKEENIIDYLPLKIKNGEQIHYIYDLVDAKKEHCLSYNIQDEQNNEWNENHRKFGNYFETEKEAEKILNYIKAFLKAYHIAKKINDKPSALNLEERVNPAWHFVENKPTWSTGTRVKNNLFTFANQENLKIFQNTMGEDYHKLFIF